MGLILPKTSCWNEAAANSDCDPNTDDDCLCGPFFDDVASCTAALCNFGDNLSMPTQFVQTHPHTDKTTGALDFMEQACN
jgi:hypothetical protein